LTECFCYQLCLSSSMFRYDCIIANFAKGLSWISRIGSRHWANF